MDYSIFVWHSYKDQQRTFPDKQEAMAHAIADTITSVVDRVADTVETVVDVVRDIKDTLFWWWPF